MISLVATEFLAVLTIAAEPKSGRVQVVDWVVLGETRELGHDLKAFLYQRFHLVRLDSHIMVVEDQPWARMHLYN